MVDLMPIELSMSAEAFIMFMFVGAVLLAAWIHMRFPRLGPRSLLGAVCGWGASGALIFAIPSMIQAVVAWDLPGVRLVVIFGIALPIFTYFFLAGGWFMR